MPDPEASPRIDASAATLTTPVRALKGVRAEVASGLEALGLNNVGRLIAHLPMRHEFEEAESTIGQIEPGRIITVRGTLTATRPVGMGKRARFEAVLMDETGRLDLVWFNQAYLAKKIHPGDRLRVQGTAQKRGPGLQCANPRFEILTEEGDEPGTRAATLRPIYPASERVNSRQIGEVIARVLPYASLQIEEQLPEALRRARELPTLPQAYRMMHAPGSEAEVAEAARRLAYDELLLLQLGVHVKRAHLRRTLGAPALRFDDAVDRRIRERLPFVLTPSQDRVVGELAADLSRTTPTNRLVQGDVGSGKTAVALYAMLLAVVSGHQGALMAPTELLAEQHFAGIWRMLEGSKVRLALLTGSLPEADRESTLARLASGEIDIVVGTHALLTERVAFASLAVAIIDEQHRFGVEQRARLRTKGAGAEGMMTPHVVVMTATPIPRTIGLTVFGDLDVSTIDGMPPGRTPVVTRVVTPEQRGEVYAWVRSRLDAGEQAFVVVPAIDTGQSGGVEGGEQGLNDLRSVVRELEEGPMSGRRVAAVHGRLRRETREHVMGRFRAGLIDLLVATTVIEVGVDVPNATVMVVEHADRFGLAQLHQLRGRVGRGPRGGVCVLVGDAKTQDGAQRLETMAKTSSGFELAEADLKIRGMGEIFGARQSGLPPFRVADLSGNTPGHLELLEQARRDAAAWVEASPRLARPEDAVIRRRLLKAYGEALGIGDVG